jgi:hypothetical protein
MRGERGRGETGRSKDQKEGTVARGLTLHLLIF